MHQSKYTPTRPPGYVGLYHDIGNSSSPQHVGDSRILSHFSLRMWGISRGFALIQDRGDRSHKDFWVHFGRLERTQVFTGICGIHFMVIQINTLINLGHGFKRANALILRCRWLFFRCSVTTTSLNVADVTYEM